MNRKTNIFYNANSEDSKFLTFDNYTEALTGDILSLDYKLWPSRFICVYIENLDKEDFINKLQQYYENKLAVLRDHIETNKYVDDTYILPLNYLITFLYWYSYNNGSENALTPIEIETKMLKNEDDILNKVEFNYISDIVEQQYNGTYTDIICTINPNVWHKPSLNFVNDLDVDLNGELDVESYMSANGCIATVKNTNNLLHGWENTDNESDIYEYVQNPIMDGKREIDNEEIDVYYLKSLISELQINNVTTETDLKFNLLIPLFDVTNSVNANDINDDEDEDVIKLISDNETSNNDKKTPKNIPLGIYFTDKVVELNISGKFATNWSLLISTQFSAFPFSFDITQNFDDSQSNKQAYLTFAEILSNQTNFTDALQKYDNIVKSLEKRISMLESNMNNISSVQNIDSVVQKVANLTKSIDDYISSTDEKLAELENMIEENKLKWQIKQKNTQ